MHEITLGQLVKALQAVGVQPEDGLLVHSAIQFLGRPTRGVGLYYQGLCTVLDSLSLEILGHRSEGATQPDLTLGTIAVPTFNFAFARGERYDPKSSPSTGMGTFSEYVRELPQSQRTTHPMQSLAVIGRYATDLADRNTLSAFDPGSAFDRMLELDFKLLLLGSDIQAVSMLHYSEQRAGVPYRYWKDFTGEVRTPKGWETRTYRMYVRDLDLDPHIELYPVQEILENRAQWTSIQLNYGRISHCRLRDFVLALDEFLLQDPWSLVTNPPEKR
jgi:aminoglycoside 3-N-acetyltransferase